MYHTQKYDGVILEEHSEVALYREYQGFLYVRGAECFRPIPNWVGALGPQV